MCLCREAREKHRQYHKLVADGENPLEIKERKIIDKKINQANTFEAIALEWLDKRKGEAKEETLKTVKTRLERDLFPQIGKLPIKSINPPILLNALRKIEARGVYETTKRARQYASQIFQYAIATGRAENDPSISLVKAIKTKEVEHHKAMEISELPAFLQKINANEARLYKQTCLALRLMVLTFTRKKELTHARWQEINFKDKTWIIPAERTKMKKPHIVPLSKQALAIFEELKVINGEWEYVFTGQHSQRKPMNPDTILRALYRLGYKGDATIHGFRAMAMTAILENLGYPFDVADAQLAHSKKGSLGAAYDRAKYIKQRTLMMQDWSNYIDDLVSGKKDNKVLKFSKKR
jgi:integrase